MIVATSLFTYIISCSLLDTIIRNNGYSGQDSNNYDDDEEFYDSKALVSTHINLINFYQFYIVHTI